MKKIPFTFALFFLGLNGGCTLGPKYSPPAIEIPEVWKTEVPESSKSSESTADASFFHYWWELFLDETLNELEAEAIKNSPNLYAALNRVIEARANAGIVKSNLYPQINLNPGIVDTGQLFKIFLPPVSGGTSSLSGNGVPFVNPFGNIPTIYRIHQMQYGLLANVSYEIDLWGKLSGQYRSASMDAQAQLEAYHTTLLTLTSDLASSYFQARALAAQVSLYEATLNLRRRALELVNNRYEKGVVSYSDVAQASLELTNTESDYYGAVRGLREQENQMALLVGRPASLFCLDISPLYGSPPDVPVGLPSEVLLQRPDIAQAERQMEARHAQIGVAYASFLPSLQLTGGLGFLSPDLKNFLNWRSRYWQVAADIAQTLFDGGRNTSNLELARESFEEAGNVYRQQVLVAFKEVEDALNNLEMQAKQSESLRLSIDSAKKSAQLSLSRYNSGTVNYLEVVNTERYALDAERNSISVLGNRYLSTVQLVKALGGRW